MVTENSRATVTLLHPYHVTRARELRLCTSTPQHATAENFMTSKQLDEFCCNGKYLLFDSGVLVNRSASARPSSPLEQFTKIA
jgi:hypothetical protein